MYKFHNANARGRFVNDCVVRAIAQDEGNLLDDVNFVEGYLDKRYKRVPHYSKTVGEFAEEYPEGIYLVTMPSHITVVLDGIVHDVFDCRNRTMWTAWEVNRRSRF